MACGLQGVAMTSTDRRLVTVFFALVSILLFATTILCLSALYRWCAIDRQLSVIAGLTLAVVVECFGVPISLGISLIAAAFERWALALVFLEICGAGLFWFLNPPIVVLYLGLR